MILGKYELFSKWRWVSLITIILTLAVLTILVYRQVQNFEFIEFDDNLYVTKNSYIKPGFTKEGVHWAFQFSNETNYWQPLTWISHMADCELYGLDAGAHHLTNLTIHLLNVALLFLFLNTVTGAAWRSAFVAAMFSLHPVNVDSVAWVANRKTLLSSFFWLTTLQLYYYYTKKPNLIRYLYVMGTLVLGLMTKSILVTLPFLLLLLDYWPFGRLNAASNMGLNGIRALDKGFVKRRVKIVFILLLEKLPLFSLSALSVLISILSIEGYDPTISFESVPMKLRIKNAVLSYIVYIRQMFYPTDLAVYYPYPKSIPLLPYIGALIVLIFVSIAVVHAAKRIPYLFVGWFWYIGTLIPAIGLVQQGLWPAHADRWVYIPMIGLFIMVSWTVADLAMRWRYYKILLPTIGLAAIGAAALLSYRQGMYWQNSVTLFEHTVSVTKNSYIFRNKLGKEFQKQKKIPEAIIQFSKALEDNPNYADAINNLGLIEWEQGEIDTAAGHFLRVLKNDSDNAEALNNLGIIRMEQGNLQRARQLFLKSLIRNPELAQAHYNLAILLEKENKFSAARYHYLEALRISPDDAKVYNNLGNLLARRGKFMEAIKHFYDALRYKPEYAELQNNLGSALVMAGLKSEAIHHYREAVRIKPDLVEAYLNLGQLMIETQKFKEAIQYFVKAASYRPNSFELQLKLGEIHDALGAFDRAVHHYSEAARIDPDHVDARQRLEEIRERQLRRSSQ